MPPSVYDTPPDGDFARYVEELGRQSTARLLQGAPPAPPPTAAPGSQDARPRPPRSARAPGTVSVAAAIGQPSVAVVKAQLMQLIQWGFAALVVFLMASAAYPPLAMAAVPLLLAFGALAWVRLRGLPWSELIAQARQRAGAPSIDPGVRDSTRHPK
jgi:hypothetical protein